MWLGFLFILNRLFVCLFVHSFIFFGYFFEACNNTDLRPNMPEVTTGSRGYKQARVFGLDPNKRVNVFLLLFEQSSKK